MIRFAFVCFALSSIWLLFLISCNVRDKSVLKKEQADMATISPDLNNEFVLPKEVPVIKNIRVREYFEYMDSLVTKYDSLVPYSLSEHLLVRNNPWIMDALADTDYYRLIVKDSFVYDQRKMIVLPKGSVLKIPDSLYACRMLEDFASTEIDVNIPEFKLRIFQDSILMHTFPIRVGQNRERYLKFGDRVTDLKTKTGTGTVVDHVKHPDFYNPVDGKQFYLTKRDDGKTTMMPQIPWIETEINGVRNGQMIHPTTNPNTLGKPYSNGCIGTKEADAWVIYYHAPLGTKIRIRYDLERYEDGLVIALLKNIYAVEN